MANFVSPNQIQIQIGLVLLVRPYTRDDTLPIELPPSVFNAGYMLGMLAGAFVLGIVSDKASSLLETMQKSRCFHKPALNPELLMIDDLVD